MYVRQLTSPNTGSLMVSKFRVKCAEPTEKLSMRFRKLSYLSVLLLWGGGVVGWGLRRRAACCAAWLCVVHPSCVGKGLSLTVHEAVWHAGCELWDGK